MSAPFYLGVIPARGGSKRLPGKNLAPLAGRPLIDYTLRAAAGAKRLGAFVVSTDSEAIAAHARTLGAPVTMRPAAMAQDDSPVVDALRHAMERFEKDAGPRVDAIILLQPTSPLRTADDVDRAIGIFEATRADTVTAVRTARDHPYWAWRDSGDGIAPFFGPGEMAMDRSRLPQAWSESGAVYVMRRALVEAGRIYGERVAACPMDETGSVDVDTPLDLAWAEFLLKGRSA